MPKMMEKRSKVAQWGTESDSTWISFYSFDIIITNSVILSDGIICFKVRKTNYHYKTSQNSSNPLLILTDACAVVVQSKWCHFRGNGLIKKVTLITKYYTRLIKS